MNDMRKLIELMENSLSDDDYINPENEKNTGIRQFTRLRKQAEASNNFDDYVEAIRFGAKLHSTDKHLSRNDQVHVQKTCDALAGKLFRAKQ